MPHVIHAFLTPFRAVPLAHLISAQPKASPSVVTTTNYSVASSVVVAFLNSIIYLPTLTFTAIQTSQTTVHHNAGFGITLFAK